MPSAFQPGHKPSSWFRGAGPSKQTSKGGYASIVVEKGKLQVSIAVENILFARAEHVYVNIFFSNNQRVVQRSSLSGLLGQLPNSEFLQVHRSFVVNLRWVESWTKETVTVGGKHIPISRSRRKDVLQRLALLRK